ncbi:MAG: HD domain-containing protein, partial [Bacteroidales bacterium]|nr:HD domain-containing protein [Bacteroidales bacterium]
MKITERKIREDEARVVNRKYRQLLKALNSHVETKDHKRIRRAFELSLRIHQDHRRKTGDFYFIHAVDVACIVSNEMSLGPASIIAALLQDISHDGNITITGIEKRFGKKVARIVEGLDRISNLHSEKVSFHPENFIKLLLSMADDVRIILIRLANRLHFMRVLDSLKYEHRRQVALETSNLYAPIAHRLGLHKIKTELEKLSMLYSEPKVYNTIEKKLENIREDQERLAENFIRPIRKEL